MKVNKYVVISNCSISGKLFLRGDQIFMEVPQPQFAITVFTLDRTTIGRISTREFEIIKDCLEQID